MRSTNTCVRNTHVRNTTTCMRNTNTHMRNTNTCVRNINIYKYLCEKYNDGMKFCHDKS